MSFSFDLRLAPVRGVLQWTVWKRGPGGKHVGGNVDGKVKERTVHSLENDTPLLDDGEIIGTCRRRMVVKLDDGWRFIDEVESQARLSFLDDVKVGP